MISQRLPHALSKLAETQDKPVQRWSLSELIAFMKRNETGTLCVSAATKGQYSVYLSSPTLPFVVRVVSLSPVRTYLRSLCKTHTSINLLPATSK